MADATLNLTPQVYRYLIDHSVREPEILAELRIETHKLSDSRCKSRQNKVSSWLC